MIVNYLISNKHSVFLFFNTISQLFLIPNSGYKSTIKEIREIEVDVQTENGVVTVQNDWVLSLTGYQPNLSFLQKAGIDLSDDEIRNPSYNEETHETNVENIFLAGVICGGMNTHRLFIENSREHAVKIIEVIKLRNK